MVNTGVSFPYSRPAEAPTPSKLRPIVEQALREDLGGELGISRDLTTAALVNPAESAAATIHSRQKGVVAGLDLARIVFAVLDRQVLCDGGGVEDGSGVTEGETILRLRGPAAAILTGERTTLNFLQHLSGIATLTRAYVEAVAHTPARITDTRKTTPGLRMLEKYAVRCGGGVSHRIGLADAVLIKENHAALTGGVAQAASHVRRSAPSNGSVDVMVEATGRADVEELLHLPPDTQPDRILLDNMSAAEMTAAVSAIRAHGKSIAVEATGGITLANVRTVAETGVDLISVGALTHSAPALDISLLIE